MFILFMTLLCSFAASTYGLEKEITINVDPLKEDCFFQTLKTSESVEIEYQVIGGGHGDLDISFYLADPTGRILVTEFKKTENSHSFEAKMDGDIKFCFDNTFSSFNSKTVFFELIVYNSDEDQWGQKEQYDFIDKYGEEIEGVKIEDVYEVINTLRSHLSKARLLQDMIKSTQAKDRNVAEETFFRVNIYSSFILVLMGLVSFVQIVMVKSLFDDHSKIHQIWNYLNSYKT